MKDTTRSPKGSPASDLFALGAQDLQRTFRLGYVQASYLHTCFKRMKHHGATLAMVEDEQLVFHRDGAWFETYHAPSPAIARAIWDWAKRTSSADGERNPSATMTDTLRAVGSSAIVRPYVEGEDLLGRMMCYRCRYSFPAPKGKLMAHNVKCPNCKAVDAYYQHKCHESDPNRHSAGWPYDDPTVECDC